MSKIERLVQNYKRFLSVNPWDKLIAGAQRVWFSVYDKADERKLRVQLDEFELGTKAEGHTWKTVDVTNDFACWMASLEYRDSYFENPDDLEMTLAEFETHVANRIKTELDGSSENMVVAIYGIASLYGFLKVSNLMNKVQSSVKGRLLVFFPGEYEKGVYRLLDARDGWNYLALPITTQEGILSA
jgi:hypothetical protein